MFGWEFTETDMTGFPYLHISIYPLADGKIKIFPVVKARRMTMSISLMSKVASGIILYSTSPARILPRYSRLAGRITTASTASSLTTYTTRSCCFFIKFSFVSFLSFLYMLLVLRRFAFDIGNERYKINKNYEKIIFFCENICFFKKKVVTLRARC